MLATIENYQYSIMRTLHMNCHILLNISKHKIDKFIISPFKTCLGSRHLYFFKYKQGINMCVMSIFHPRLNFHFGLAKPSQNFNSVYRVDIFTSNCYVVLKRSLLFSRHEISTQFNELKFQPELKISIQSAPENRIKTTTEKQKRIKLNFAQNNLIFRFRNIKILQLLLLLLLIIIITIIIIIMMMMMMMMIKIKNYESQVLQHDILR